MKARYAMLEPSDSVTDWILAQLPGMGACWCPPGVGLGGDITVLDVKVATAASHAALLPVAIVPNCDAARYTRSCVRAEMSGWVGMACKVLGG